MQTEIKKVKSTIKLLKQQMKPLLREHARLDREINKAIDKKNSKLERRLVSEQYRIDKIIDAIVSYTYTIDGIGVGNQP